MRNKYKKLSIWIGIAAIFLSVVCLSVYWGQNSGPSFAADGGTYSNQLTRERDEAVKRGLGWLESYFDDDNHFMPVGLDAVTIFLEASITSRNPLIRDRAGRVAHVLARRLEQHYVSEADSLEIPDVIDILDFLAEARPLGFDPTRLLVVAERLFSESKSDEDVYGVPTGNLRGASEDTIYEILMSAYSLEKANAAYGDRFKVGFQLKDILLFLKSRSLTPYGEYGDTGNRMAQDHAYLATHMAYVLNNYGRIRLSEKDAPFLFKYLRDNYDAVLALEDIELVGEFIDVFRSMGYTSATDSMVRTGTRFLLQAQNEDGSWGRWWDEEDPYDAIHYTWCAMAGLRDRTFLQDTQYSKRVQRILKQVHYH